MAFARASRRAISTALSCSGGQQAVLNNCISRSTTGEMASTLLATTISTFQVRSEATNSHGGSSSSFCCFIFLFRECRVRSRCEDFRVTAVHLRIETSPDPEQNASSAELGQLLEEA